MIELARRPDGALRQGFGGDTMNTAIYLARLGVSVAFVTALGRDPESASMIAALEREAVGTRLIARVADRLPGLYIIDVDAAGERRFLYWRDRAPARELFTLPENPALLDALGGFGLLYLSGISLAIWGERGRAVLFAALDRLRHEGVRIAFDSNWRPLLWTDRETARTAYAAMLARTDIALAGAGDLADLFDDEDARAMLARLRAAGVAEICLRLPLGLDGPACVVAHGEVEARVAAAPVTRVVDTTAAGDSFSAGYLAARMAGEDPQAAARAAHRLAAIVIGHPGAIVPRAATESLATEIRTGEIMHP